MDGLFAAVRERNAPDGRCGVSVADSSLRRSMETQDREQVALLTERVRALGGYL
jgi:hypothetical protein